MNQLVFGDNNNKKKRLRALRHQAAQNKRSSGIAEFASKYLQFKFKNLKKGTVIAEGNRSYFKRINVEK